MKFEKKRAESLSSLASSLSVFLQRALYRVHLSVRIRNPHRGRPRFKSPSNRANRSRRNKKQTIR